MEKNFDVIALGELLIDFTMNGLSTQGNAIFEANPGGAPCNVLAMLGKLGRKTAFIGKVGNDQFGNLLKKILEELSIETENLVMSDEYNTTLAFVHTAADGDRSFSFYRNPGADMMLNERDINEDLLCRGKIFHFGTLSMTHEGVRSATRKAISLARAQGLLISFDPNLRLPLWDSEGNAREQMLYGMSQCDILKLADDELAFLTGSESVEEGVRDMRQKSPARLIVITKGKKGSEAFCNGVHVAAQTFLKVPAVDTTGAGDTFYGCVLNTVLEFGLDKLGRTELANMLQFANAAATLITTHKGALRVMPERKDILDLIGNGERALV
jgi:Sugar kinases, ribokinase family